MPGGIIRFAHAGTFGPSYPYSPHQPSHNSIDARRAFQVFDSRLAPQLFEGAADLAVRDRGSR